MVKYSIIVPVFNVESVLERCIKSILSQTITDFECILVDDGSSDNSGKICDEYSKRDKRIKVFHTENEGVSKARNKGLDVARGENIVFVDSDDYIEADCLATFEVQGFDLIMSSSYTCEEDLTIKSKNILEKKELNELDDNLILSILNSWHSQVVWAKCFKRNIIDKENISFLDYCNYGEDTIFFAEYLRACSSVCMMEKVTYRHYRYAKHSLSTIQDSERIKKYHVLSEKKYDLFCDRENIKKFILKRYWWSAELEIESIIGDNTITDRYKADCICSILNMSMSRKCLRCNICGSGWKNVMNFKLISKPLLICWLKIRKIRGKNHYKNTYY